MSLLDELIGIKKILINGVEAAFAQTINLIGDWTIVEDKANKRINVTPPAGGGGSSLNPPANPGDNGKLPKAINGNFAYLGGISNGQLVIWNAALGWVVGQARDDSVADDAAIAGTKIDPDFGAQNVVTTGSVTGGSFVTTGFVGVGASLPSTGSFRWAHGSSWVGLSSGGGNVVLGRFGVLANDILELGSGAIRLELVSGSAVGGIRFKIDGTVAMRLHPPGLLVVGNQGGAPTTPGTALGAGSYLSVTTSEAANYEAIAASSVAAAGVIREYGRSRGTPSTPEAIQTGDVIDRESVYAYHNGAWQQVFNRLIDGSSVGPGVIGGSVTWSAGGNGATFGRRFSVQLGSPGFTVHSDGAGPATLVLQRTDALGDVSPSAAAVTRRVDVAQLSGAPAMIATDEIVWDYADPENSALPIAWKVTALHNGEELTELARTGQLVTEVDSAVPVQIMSFPIADGEMLDIQADVTLIGDQGVASRAKRVWSTTFVRNDTSVVRWPDYDVDLHPLTDQGLGASFVDIALEPDETNAEYVRLMVTSWTGENTPVPVTAVAKVTVSRTVLGPEPLA